MTRSDKDKKLQILSNSELAKLERENRKAVAQAKAKEKELKMVRTVILRENAEGHLVDNQGNRYNEEGQRLDATGAVMNPQPNQEEQPMVNYNGGPVDPNRTLADYNRPATFYANRSAITLPAVQREDFELKLQYYTAVGKNQFHGLPNEHPMDHLDLFEGIVRGLIVQGVDRDWIYCQLFPYSLAGEALNWLNTHPAGTFTTWEDTRKAFLDHFFDDAKSEELRTKISTFEQGPRESFKNAWTRFQKYQRDCPHHGFTDPQLLGTFFKGVDWRYQQSLDAASNGNFNTRNPATAFELIKNLTQSNSTKRCDELRVREAASNPQDMSEVKASLQSIQNMLLNKKKAVTFVDEFEQKEEDVNFVGGAGFQGQRFNNYRNNFNSGSSQGGYQRTYGNEEYKKPGIEGIHSVLEQILEGQSKMIGDFNGKIDTVYQDMNQKFSEINIHLKKLDTQVAQTAEGLRRQNGSLPGSTNQNPRQHVNAISISLEKDEVVEDLGDGTGHEEEDLDEFEQEKSKKSRNSIFSMSFAGQKNEKARGLAIARPDPQRSLGPNSSEKLAKSKTGNLEQNVYKTKVPYPKLPKRTKEEVEAAKYKKIVEMLGAHIPFFKECHMASTSKAYVEMMVNDTLSLQDGVMMIADICSKKVEKLEKRGPKKLNDPGCFLLNCKIKGRTFDGVLCDSGSSVNVIPLSSAEGLGELQPCPWTIIFADQSAKKPAGWIIDVPVEVGGHTILTDFVVMELDKEPQQPFILGRGFLATTGAIIDFKNGLVHLHLPGEVLKFKMDRGPETLINDQLHYANTILVASQEEKVLDVGEKKESAVDQPKLVVAPSVPATAVQQKAPHVKPPKEPRYVSSKPISKHKYLHTFAGKGCLPPHAAAHPCAIPPYLGRNHVPTAYTPPWMRRFLVKHSMPLSQPPDI